MVARSDPRLGLGPRIEVGFRESLHDLEVSGRVAREQVLVRRRLGSQARFRPDQPQQVDPGPEATRRQRMARAEVVRERPRAEHEQRDVGHPPTIAAMERAYTTPLLDKLGVRPGSRVALVGEVDPDGTFRERLAERTNDVTV